MGYLIFRVVTGMKNKIPLMTLMIKNTHDRSIDKPYECGHETLERGFLAKSTKFILCKSENYYFPTIHG